MGFDLDKQRSYTLPGGGRGEAGRIDFSSASFCQAVPTTMVSIYAWNAFPAIDVTGQAFDLNMFENRATVDIDDITNSNIIVKRSTFTNAFSASYYYEIKGW